MKNKVSDLRDHMFAALERLSNEDLNPEQLLQEIQRSQAVSQLGKVVVESAKAEIMFARLTGERNDEAAKFLEAEVPKYNRLERPPSSYSNKSPMGLANPEGQSAD